MAMHKYFAIFLALVAFHGSVFAHGRQIKPLNQHKNSHHPSTAPLKTSNDVPTPSEDQLKVDSPIIPKHDVADIGSGDSGANHANAFRPTTPGNSPGAGHRKFEKEDEDTKVMEVVQSPDVNVSMAEGFKYDFKPTNPRHSPGIGHPRENKSGQLN